jgi:uncharacterized protein involved in exopolysaccharide biosynthesis
MVEQRQAVNRKVGMARPRPLAVAALTPKDVFSMLRRHILLIASMIILGLIIGGAAWYLLREYLPRYTAQTFIKVLPPVDKDPRDIGGILVARDIQYGHRVSIANRIKQQKTLQDLLDIDKVRETEWFRHFGKIEAVRILEAFRDLKKHFGAYAHRDADYVLLTMSCGDATEAADIVNEMVTLFLKSQGLEKKEEVSDKLNELEKRRRFLRGEVDDADKALTTIRMDSGMTDLDRPLGRYFRHTIELKLDDLELEQNDLKMIIKQVEAQIKNLEELATGPINEQVEHQIEIDPVMVVLAQELAFTESRLAGLLTKFGENHRIVRQTQQLIREIREKRRIRKAEIAEQTRHSINWLNLNKGTMN